MRSITVFACLIAALTLVGGILPLSQAFAATLTSADWQALRAGKILLSEEQRGNLSDNHRNIVARVLFKRPLHAVWQVVSDPQGVFAHEPRMKKITVLSRPTPTRAMVEYTMALSPILPRFVFITQVDYTKPTRFQFQRVSGSFRNFEGDCLLTPEGADQTLITYAMYLDLGPFIPQWLVRQFVRSDLPHMIQQVQHQVELQPMPADHMNQPQTTQKPIAKK